MVPWQKRLGCSTMNHDEPRCASRQTGLQLVVPCFCVVFLSKYWLNCRSCRAVVFSETPIAHIERVSSYLSILGRFLGYYWQQGPQDVLKKNPKKCTMSKVARKQCETSELMWRAEPKPGSRHGFISISKCRKFWSSQVFPRDDSQYFVDFFVRRLSAPRAMGACCVFLFEPSFSWRPRCVAFQGWFSWLRGTICSNYQDHILYLSL